MARFTLERGTRDRLKYIGRVNNLDSAPSYNDMISVSGFRTRQFFHTVQTGTPPKYQTLQSCEQLTGVAVSIIHHAQAEDDDQTRQEQEEERRGKWLAIDTPLGDDNGRFWKRPTTISLVGLLYQTSTVTEILQLVLSMKMPPENGEQVML